MATLLGSLVHSNGLGTLFRACMWTGIALLTLNLGSVSPPVATRHALPGQATTRTTTSASHLGSFASGDAWDLERANRWVFANTEHSAERRIAVTENWLQWLLSRGYPPLARIQDPGRLLAGRKTDCSERCQILKTIVERAGRQCRFIGLSGHVVLEVREGRQWRVADPDYGVVYEQPFEQLQKPSAATAIRARLGAAGHSKAAIDLYLGIMQSTADNQRLPVGSPLSPRLYGTEVACDWLVWIIPGLLVLSGALGTTLSKESILIRAIRDSRLFKPAMRAICQFPSLQPSIRREEPRIARIIRMKNEAD